MRWCRTVLQGCLSEAASCMHVQRVQPLADRL
jgi:hypothetical protein